MFKIQKKLKIGSWDVILIENNFLYTISENKDLIKVDLSNLEITILKKNLKHIIKIIKIINGILLVNSEGENFIFDEEKVSSFSLSLNEKYKISSFFGENNYINCCEVYEKDNLNNREKGLFDLDKEKILWTTKESIIFRKIIDDYLFVIETIKTPVYKKPNFKSFSRHFILQCREITTGKLIWKLDIFNLEKIKKLNPVTSDLKILGKYENKLLVAIRLEKEDEYARDENRLLLIDIHKGELLEILPLPFVGYKLDLEKGHIIGTTGQLYFYDIPFSVLANITFEQVPIDVLRLGRVKILDFDKDGRNILTAETNIEEAWKRDKDNTYPLDRLRLRNRKFKSLLWQHIFDDSIQNAWLFSDKIIAISFRNVVYILKQTAKVRLFNS